MAKSMDFATLVEWTGAHTATFSSILSREGPSNALAALSDIIHGDVHAGTQAADESAASSGSEVSSDEEDAGTHSEASSDCLSSPNCKATSEYIKKRMRSPRTPYHYKCSPRTPGLSPSALPSAPAATVATPGKRGFQAVAFPTPLEFPVRLTPATMRTRQDDAPYKHARYQFGSQRLRSTDNDNGLVFCAPPALSSMMNWKCKCVLQADRNVATGRQLGIFYAHCTTCDSPVKFNLHPPASEMASRIQVSGQSWTDVSLLLTSMQVSFPVSKSEFYRGLPAVGADISTLLREGIDQNFVYLAAIVAVCSDADLVAEQNFVLEMDGTWNVSKVGSSCDASCFIQLPKLAPTQLATLRHELNIEEESNKHWDSPPSRLLLGMSHMYKALPSDLKAVRQKDTGGTGLFTNSSGLEYPCILELCNSVLPRLPTALKQVARVTLDGDGSTADALFQVAVPKGKAIPGETRPVVLLQECIGHKLKNVRSGLTDIKYDSSAAWGAVSALQPAAEISKESSMAATRKRLGSLGVQLKPTPPGVAAAGVQLQTQVQLLPAPQTAPASVLELEEETLPEHQPHTDEADADVDASPDTMAASDVNQVLLLGSVLSSLRDASEPLAGFVFPAAIPEDVEDEVNTLGDAVLETEGTLEEELVEVAPPEYVPATVQLQQVPTTSSSKCACRSGCGTKLCKCRKAGFYCASCNCSGCLNRQGGATPPVAPSAPAVAAPAAKAQRRTAAMASLSRTFGYRFVGWVRYILKFRKPATQQAFEKELEDALQHWCGDHSKCTADCPVQAGTFRSHIWQPVKAEDIAAATRAQEKDVGFIAEIRGPKHKDRTTADMSLYNRTLTAIASLVRSFEAIKSLSTTNICEAFNRIIHKYIIKDRYNPIRHPILAKMAALDEIFGRGTWRAVLAQRRGYPMERHDLVAFKRLDHLQKMDHTAETDYMPASQVETRRESTSNSRSRRIALARITRVDMVEKLLPGYVSGGTIKEDVIASLLTAAAVKSVALDATQAKQALASADLTELFDLAACATSAGKHKGKTTL